METDSSNTEREIPDIRYHRWGIKPDITATHQKQHGNSHTNYGYRLFNYRKGDTTRYRLKCQKQHGNSHINYGHSQTLQIQKGRYNQISPPYIRNNTETVTEIMDAHRLFKYKKGSRYSQIVGNIFSKASRKAGI